MTTVFPPIDGVTYSMVQSVGNGGNSQVFEVQSSADGRSYALKRIGKQSSEKNKRFQREIEFGKRADHPNVVRIHGSECDDDAFYYVMDLFPKNLRDVIRDERDPEVLLHFLVQLFKAVEYVHGEGVVHRDIKPANVLIDVRSDRLVLADFGIAHFKDSTMTERNNLLANRNYLAPEQMQGQDAREVREPADVFALGLIANEMFTKQYARGVAHRRIADAQPGIGSLDELVDQMMYQDPDRRIGIRAALDWLRLIQQDTATDDVLANLRDASENLMLPRSADDVFERAARDVVVAKRVFEGASERQLERYNLNYHCEISYSVSDELFATCVQFEIFNKCKAKFDTEAPTTFDDTMAVGAERRCTPEHLHELQDILAEYPLPSTSQWRWLPRRSLQYFRFCKDYHCAELLDSIRGLLPNAETGSKGELQVGIVSAPILWLTRKVRGYLQLDGGALSETDLRHVQFDLNVAIDWAATDVDDATRRIIGENLLDDQSIPADVGEVLARLTAEWHASYAALEGHNYAVFFRSDEDYERFATHARELAANHYVFEGDVLDLLRPRAARGDITELRWDESFDLGVTAAKVVGLRPVLE